MRNVYFVLVELMYCFFRYKCLGLNVEANAHSDNQIHPWIGILRVRSGPNVSDAVTGLILIRNNLAAGIANEVAKVEAKNLRKISNAVFYNNYKWRRYGVAKYTLHPEHYKGVCNTLALVHLSCDTEDTLSWSPISWPTVYTATVNVYSIWLSDRHRRLQQVTEEMEPVTDTECDEFYKKEKLDYKSLQPSHRVCYKVLNAVNHCVMDAGMALAVRSRKKWILIGISTLGPSCSFPARFVKFLPYVSWIKSHSTPVNTRRSWRRTYDLPDLFDEQGMEEPFEDRDTFLLSRINDNTIVMRPTLANVNEDVYGYCGQIDGVLMYREFGTIRAPSYTATGVYSLSLYDLFFPKITCVTVTVVCNQRSHIRYWVDTGFHQEDIYDYVKIMPSIKRNNTIPPKIMYIKDLYKKYRTIGISNLEFKFEFTNEAKIDMEFYGKNISSPMRSPNVAFLPLQKQTHGKLPGGAEFNTRDDDPDDSLDVTNDSFYHS